MADDSSEVVKEMTEASAATNVKVVSELPAAYAGLQMQQALNNSAGWAAIQQSIVSKASDLILNSSAQDLAGESALLGQIAKLLQMTPPPTNIPTQGQ